MEAPQRSRLSTFSRPMKPAPTTRHRFPSSFRNKGKSLARSLKMFSPDWSGVPAHRLEHRAGKLFAQLLVAGAGKISAQVFTRVASLQVATEQPFQRIRHFGCQAAVPNWPGDLLMQAYRAADAKVVSVFELAPMLDLLAFDADVGDPMLSAAIGAAGHVQLQLLVEARQPHLEFVNNPAGKALGFGNGQFAEFTASAGNRASPESRTYYLQRKSL